MSELERVPLLSQSLRVRSGKDNAIVCPFSFTDVKMAIKIEVIKGGMVDYQVVSPEGKELHGRIRGSGEIVFEAIEGDYQLTFKPGFILDREVLVSFFALVPKKVFSFCLDLENLYAMSLEAPELRGMVKDKFSRISEEATVSWKFLGTKYKDLVRKLASKFETQNQGLHTA